MTNRIIAILLCFSFMFITPAVLPETTVSAEEGVSAASAIAYTGPYVQVGNVTLPLAEHMPGTFFTRDGGPCDCHYDEVDCVQNPSTCNCMRYYPTGNKDTCEIDLLSVQCFGFARLIFYKCFGFIDHSMNSDLYYSVGSLSRSEINEQSVKTLMMKAAPGAHVRLAQGHSVSILSMDDDFIYIYHGNAGGDGVTTQPCVISTRRYTWAEFAVAAAAGILYVNMPYDYPGSTNVDPAEKVTGHYRITSETGLRLRQAADVDSTSLAVIPYNEIIEVTEIDGYWGKTKYNGSTGWVFLEYTIYYSAPEILPSGDVFTLCDDGYLRAVSWKMNFDSFTEQFNKQSLVITDINGNDLSSEGYIGTGATVSLVVNGETFDTAKVCLAGDVNCNGVLDVGDYIQTRRAYFHTFKLSPDALAAADVNGSGDLDAQDYIFIKRFFFTGAVALFDNFV